MRTAQQSGILRLEENAIICPTCRHKIRGVRLPPDSAMRGVEILCNSCGTRMTVNIDPTSATYSGQRH